MSLLARDAGEIEALITDRYLDSLLAVAGAMNPPVAADTAVSAAVRAASTRLMSDLPRFHPAFRFEERLAMRLAELAASMRLPVAAGAEGVPVPFERRLRSEPTPGDGPAHADRAAGERGDARPLLIGGAVAASAISLAGAWLALRRRSPMARAARAAHQLRHGGEA